MKKLTNLFVLLGLSLATILFGYAIAVELLHVTVEALHKRISESDALVLLLTTCASVYVTPPFKRKPPDL